MKSKDDFQPILDRYLMHAPANVYLDKLQVLARSGDVKIVRQTAPGIYTYTMHDGQVLSTGDAS